VTPFFSALAFQDRDGGCVVGGVAEADQERPGISLCEKGLAGSVEHDEGLAGIPMDYFYIMPAQLPSDAGAKGFGDGFFSGEPGGDMQSWFSKLLAILDFAGEQNPLQESFSELGQDLLDALDLDQINADTEDHITRGQAP
jgi:hypothetical protein